MFGGSCVLYFARLGLVRWLSADFDQLSTASEPEDGGFCRHRSIVTLSAKRPYTGW